MSNLDFMLIIPASVCTAFVFGYFTACYSCRIRNVKRRNRDYYEQDNPVSTPVQLCLTKYELNRAAIRAAKNRTKDK